MTSFDLIRRTLSMTSFLFGSHRRERRITERERKQSFEEVVIGVEKEMRTIRRRGEEKKRKTTATSTSTTTTKKDIKQTKNMRSLFVRSCTLVTATNKHLLHVCSREAAANTFLHLLFFSFLFLHAYEQ